MIPRGAAAQCPACDSFVEFDTCGWSMTVGESEDMGKGIAIEMMLWAAHDCGKK